MCKHSYEAISAAMIKSTATRIIQDVPPGTQEAAAPKLERIIGDLPSKGYFLKLLDRPHYAYKVDEVGAVLTDIAGRPAAAAHAAAAGQLRRTATLARKLSSFFEFSSLGAE